MPREHDRGRPGEKAASQGVSTSNKNPTAATHILADLDALSRNAIGGAHAVLVRPDRAHMSIIPHRLYVVNTF